MDFKTYAVFLFLIIGSTWSQILFRPPNKTTPRPTSPVKPTEPPKTKSEIVAEQMCKKYMEARFITKQLPNPLIDEESTELKESDCHKVEPLVTGGKEAEPKEFPHMALIGYGDKIEFVQWKCGGSLISNQFVLSAGHCSNSERPKWIKLGDLDISTKQEESNPTNYKIINQYIHPDYKPPKNYHDIALYKTHKTVQFNGFVRPVCLYTSNKVKTREKSVVTGWGKTATDEIPSSKLLKATILVLDPKNCQNIYNKNQAFPNGFNSTIAVCAGDLNGQKDTCQGDSGGPLQIPLRNETCMYTQIAVTSTGSSDCGDKTPAVYTRIAPYIEWIQSIVWP